MSTETVKEIIGRAIAETEFLELLFRDPDEALKGYDLTQEECITLKSIQRDDFNTVASELAERISRMGLGIYQKFGAESAAKVPAKLEFPNLKLK